MFTVSPIFLNISDPHAAVRHHLRRIVRGGVKGTGVGLSGFHGEGFGTALSDEPSGKLSLNLGILDLTSEKVRFVIDIRYQVTYKRDDVFLPINKIAQSEGLSIQVLTHQGAHHVPKDSALVQALLKAYADVTGLESFAFAIGGGT